VIEAMKETGVKRAVVISSIGVEEGKGLYWYTIVFGYLLESDLTTLILSQLTLFGHCAACTLGQ
jgi:hypothetical protein